MVHVITEVDVLVVDDKLPERWKSRDCSRLFHLLDAIKDRDR